MTPRNMVMLAGLGAFALWLMQRNMISTAPLRDRWLHKQGL